MKKVLLLAMLVLVGCSTTTYKILEHPETAKFLKECDFSLPISSDFKIGDVVVRPFTPKHFPDEDIFRLVIGFSSESDPLSDIKVSDVKLSFLTDNKSYSLTDDEITKAEFKKQWSGHKSDVNYYYAAVIPFGEQAFKPVNKNSTVDLEFKVELEGDLSLSKTFKYRLVYEEIKYFPQY